MRRTSLIGTVLCILILLPAISPSSRAESNTELFVEITSVFPYSFHHVCLFGNILNIGENIAYNVTAVFSIIGGRNGEINATLSEVLPSMAPKTGFGFSNQANGFGPVTITFSVFASNVELITKSIKGFQIGYSTLIMFPILRNVLFSLMLQKYI